jgi:hypothetical protein
MIKPTIRAISLITIAIGAAVVHAQDTKQSGRRPAATAGAAQPRANLTTAESNKLTMERFTREFLPTGDQALSEQFISPDIVMHFVGQQQRGRDAHIELRATLRPHLSTNGAILP